MCAFACACAVHTCVRSMCECERVCILYIRLIKCIMSLFWYWWMTEVKYIFVPRSSRQSKLFKLRKCISNSERPCFYRCSQLSLRPSMEYKNNNSSSSTKQERPMTKWFGNFVRHIRYCVQTVSQEGYNTEKDGTYGTSCVHVRVCLCHSENKVKFFSSCSFSIFLFFRFSETLILYFEYCFSPQCWNALRSQQLSQYKIISYTLSRFLFLLSLYPFAPPFTFFFFFLWLSHLCTQKLPPKFRKHFQDAVCGIFVSLLQPHTRFHCVYKLYNRRNVYSYIPKDRDEERKRKRESERERDWEMENKRYA